MNVETTVLLTILVPILGSFATPLAGLAARRVRSIWAVLVSGATAVLPLTLIPFALKGGELVVRKNLAMGFDFILVIDPLSIFMAGVSSFVGFLIVVYSLGYIHKEENQNEYYLMVLLFIGAMMGLVFSGNLIFLYLFWEIIAICCWRLIGFYREPVHVRKADKAFLITFFGAVVMLLGFIQIYNVTNTFDITAMRGTLVPGTAVLLILFGLFSKSATVPLHTWLPDAGVGQPGVERDRGRFREQAEEDEQDGRPGNEGAAHGRDVEGIGDVVNLDEPEEHDHGAEKRDQERLVGLADVDRLAVEADQPPAADGDDLPEEVEEDEVPREDETHHGPDEEQDHQVILVLVLFLVDVAQGIDDDQEADEGRDPGHEDRQGIDDQDEIEAHGQVLADDELPSLESEGNEGQRQDGRRAAHQDGPDRADAPRGEPGERRREGAEDGDQDG